MSAKIRLPKSVEFPRVMITFNRPGSGRNLGGILSQVFLPIITAFRVLVLVAPWAGTYEVTSLKNAISALMPGQGSLPWCPIPIGGFKEVATMMYIGFARMKIGVTMVVVVLRIFLEDGEGIAGSSSDVSTGGRFDVGSSVGEGGSERVVEGGVGKDILL